MPSRSGKKRSSPDNADSSTESKRATKVQKTSNGKKAAPAAKPALPVSEFKKKAAPLHLHLTHTPPSINARDNEPKSEVVAAELDSAAPMPGGEEPAKTLDASEALDAGAISTLTLLPSSFTTGSYGWKGSKKVWVELQNGEVGEDGKKEKVQVMLTINATVVGSKQGKGKGGKGAAEAEDDAGEDAAEDVEAKDE